jgi:mycofactocin system glycosyltransferase
VLDQDTEVVAGGVLIGGSPRRLMRLSGAGARAFRELRDGSIRSRAAGTLARRLTDAGMAHPCPPAPAGRLDVTVVIPVRDRPRELDRCLSALGGDHPVVVVDDGSADGAAVAAVCARHGVTLERRGTNGGPAAARNTGLRIAGTDLVAFLDSDCVPEPGWVRSLAGHFADPLVAAVAPRTVPLAGNSRADRYTRSRSPLDLGDRAARVAPLTRVSYMPTTALVVRRAAVTGGFDESMRVGEDVDLVWRLVERGRRVRYDPSVRVGHAEPEGWRALLTRRYRYGTSAAPLTRRHPGSAAPLVLQPWPGLAVAALLCRRPGAAVAAYAAGAALLARRLRKARLPVAVTRPMAEAVLHTWLGTGRWSVQVAAPAVLAMALRPGAGRLVATALLAGPPLHEWLRRRPSLNLLGFSLGMLADEIAYGAGVWHGCVRERLWTPLLPVIRLSSGPRGTG